MADFSIQFQDSAHPTHHRRELRTATRYFRHLVELFLDYPPIEIPVASPDPQWPKDKRNKFDDKYKDRSYFTLGFYDPPIAHSDHFQYAHLLDIDIDDHDSAVKLMQDPNLELQRSGKADYKDTDLSALGKNLRSNRFMFESLNSQPGSRRCHVIYMLSEQLNKAEYDDLQNKLFDDYEKLGISPDRKHSHGPYRIIYKPAYYTDYISLLDEIEMDEMSAEVSQ